MVGGVGIAAAVDGGDEGGGGERVVVDADEDAVGAGGVCEGGVGGVAGEELERCGFLLVDELLLLAHGEKL